MKSRLGIALTAALFLCGSASATIIANTGNTDVITTGLFMVQNAYNQPITHGWDERQNTVLAADVLVDIAMPGNLMSPGSISAGTRVSSHYFIFDPLTISTTAGSFRFSERIIGIIVNSQPGMDKLFASDAQLANPLAVGPGGHVNLRGLEATGDFISLSADRFTVIFGLTANPGDQFRVITEAATTTIPEPCSLALLGAGLIGLTLKRRL